MGRFYSAIVTEAAITAASDLMKILAPSDAIVRVHSVIVTANAAAADVMDILVQRAAGGAVTPAVTPEKLEVGSAAFGGTIVDLSGAAQSTLTGLPIVQEFVDVRAGFFWQPPPDERIDLSPSGILIIRSNIAVTSTELKVVAVFEAIGG